MLKPIPERNKRIAIKILKGASCGVVAREYGITLERVRQINANVCRRVNLEKYKLATSGIATVNTKLLRKSKNHFLQYLI